eukprot:SAG31_NODE_29081_length_401_cov_0.731788_1_plen_50_part_10
MNPLIADVMVRGTQAHSGIVAVLSIGVHELELASWMPRLQTHVESKLNF